MANFKYKQLADWLKDQLKNGTFLAGQKIPTESDLAEQFALSRRTVRQAVLMLEEEGYLHRIQGSGTYVTERAEELAPEKPEPAAPANKLIGIMLSGAQLYIFPEIVRGASEYLASKGYLLNMMFSDNDYNNERKLLGNLLAAKPAGILLEPVNPAMISYNYEVYDQIMQKTPLIFLHKDYSTLAPALSLHDREGGRILTDYLLDQGHTQIGTIFAFHEQTGQSRYLGMLDALNARGISHSEELEIWTQRGKVEDLFQPTGNLPLMRMLKKATAIFCHDDRIAYMLIPYLRSINVRVPEDISVVGYDDCLYSTLDVKITTMTHPKIQYGVNAAKAMLELIESPETFDITKYEVIPELVVRSTVAPIAGAVPVPEEKQAPETEEKTESE